MDFIDLKTQYKNYAAEYEPLFADILSGARFILGSEVKELEAKLAEYTGAKHAIACASGTDALQIPLMAAGIGPGDEVITTPFTFIATVEVISLVGATPVFIDISEEDYNMNPSLIEAAITEKTKAILPVSLYGQCADMDEINAIAKKHGLLVIEDGCQSFGSIYKGKKSGNLSTVGATSFFPSKPLGCYGDGGMIFASDEEMSEKMRQIANHGQNARYKHKYIGLNSRLDNLQAAVLLVKFAHFEEECEARAKIGGRYSELFEGSNVVFPKKMPFADRHVYAQYSVRVKNREAVQAALSAKGIPSAVHYPIPIHLQEAYQFLGMKEGSLPVSEKVSNEIMSLPMHPFLSKEDQDEVVAAVTAAAK